MLFRIHPSVRRVLVICVAASAAALSVFKGGLVTNVFLELGIILLLYNLPYLLNRAQHISLRSGPGLADLESVRDPTSLRAISYNLFMRPGIAWIKGNYGTDACSYQVVSHSLFLSSLKQGKKNILVFFSFL